MPADGESLDTFEAGTALAGGRYLLEERLGRGGMGTVWRARQVALDREVAIKVLLRLDASARARLRREALALAAVHHPAIVQVHDFGETEDGRPFLVMELVRGPTLAKWLDERNSVPAAEAVRLMSRLLEGLAAAHAAGIVHRDLKPENVVLAQDGGTLAPKLLDFGIARHARTDARITAEDAVIGTPSYMAPEQFFGATNDPRVDVWAAGAVLYELMTGEPPFAADDLMSTMRRALEAPLPYPRRARGLDGRLWSILSDAMRKDPKDRIADARALHDRLAAWLASDRAVRATERVSIAHPLPRDARPALPSEPPPSLDALIRAKLLPSR